MHAVVLHARFKYKKKPAASISLPAVPCVSGQGFGSAIPGRMWDALRSGRLDGRRRGQGLGGGDRVVDHGALLEVPLAGVLQALVVDGLHGVRAAALDHHQAGHPLGAVRHGRGLELLVAVGEATLGQPGEVVGVEHHGDVRQHVGGDAQQLDDGVAHHVAGRLEVDVHGGDRHLGVGDGPDVPPRDPREGHVHVVGVEGAEGADHDVAVGGDADDRLGLEELLGPRPQIVLVGDVPHHQLTVLVRGDHHEVGPRQLQEGRPRHGLELFDGRVVQMHLPLLQKNRSFVSLHLAALHRNTKPYGVLRENPKFKLFKYQIFS